MTGTGPHPYAGVVSRGIAYLVDALLFAVLAILTVAAVELVGAVTGLRTRQPGRHSGLALPLLFAGYQFAFLGLAARTPGLALLGLRLVGTGGRAPSWPTVAVRVAVATVFPPGFLWCIVDRRHPAVHDKLARTYVVRAEPPRRYR
jgi:uncharacterized RDD family membrane protein YckC